MTNNSVIMWLQYMYRGCAQNTPCSSSYPMWSCSKEVRMHST